MIFDCGKDAQALPGGSVDLLLAQALQGSASALVVNMDLPSCKKEGR